MARGRHHDSDGVERNQISLRVLYKNSVIFKSDADNANHDTPVIVYQICGDHAYFYEDGVVKNGAVQLRTGPCKILVKAENLLRLRTRADEDDALPFAEMVEFSLDAFLEQVATNISKTFYCYQREIRDVKLQLEEAKVPIWTGLGARPELIRSLNLCSKKKDKYETKGKAKPTEKKVQIRVRVVPDDAHYLQDATVCFSEQTGLKIVYNGEGKSVINFRMLNTLFVSRRMKIPDEVREMIKLKQGCNCALCGEKLGSKYEIDHVSPKCQSGTDDIENLRALCRGCHAEKTDKLLLAGMELNDTSKFHTIESHMSPKLYRELHQAPKPKEVSYGVFQDDQQLKNRLAPKKQPQEKVEERAKKMLDFQRRFLNVKKNALKTKHIKDALLGHDSAEIVSTERLPVLPSHVAQLKCLDAVGCRLNALVKR